MSKQLIFALVITATGTAASAQTVSFGAIGGAHLTDPTGAGDESRRYIVGPTVELRFFDHFAVEADALYQRVGDTSLYYFALGTPSSSYVNRERGNSWAFPLLAKYYFRPRSETWQPFAGTGYVFRTTSFHSDTSETTTDANGNPIVSTFHSDFRSSLQIGASVVAGVRFHKGRLAFLPQLRYTRWGESYGSLANRNEVGILLGVTF